MIILDTHIWLWWVNGDTEKLDQRRLEQITSSDIVAVSAISSFEVAWLVHHGRIVLPIGARDWFDKALDGSGIHLIPITPEIACKAVELPDHHSDPQDRIIIATALVNNASLMSSDRKFSCYTELGKMLL
uniref:PIN domain-containing protein n=1 Tax=Chlorobium chlorochromatii (strain CaD3) TaxID=340177 RepID=Q3ASU2_CHLCH